MQAGDEDALEMKVDWALAEYLQKCDAGSLPEREIFLSQHPELRDQLAELLQAVDWIERLAGPTVGDSSAGNASSASKITSATKNSEDVLLRQTLVAETLPVQPTLVYSQADQNARINDRDFSHDLPRLSSLSQMILPCQFGDYILEKLLGRGGMGVVYSGRQVHLDRAVAVKMIRSGALASIEEVQRFYTEARSAAKLDHPNIVTVYQCGECENHHYFSMDYVRGSDLARLMQAGPVDCKRAARYVRDVARAIQYAHERGILHRDLKPANVLVDEDDVVHVTDFGLAKVIGHETGLTATGAAIGTPSYMSPEQAAGRNDEHSTGTDIYSLGAILFALVTGRPPFQGTSVVQTIMHVIHRPAPLAREILESVDVDMETIIAKCLRKKIEDRYISADELAEDLDRYMLGEPIKARPVSQTRRLWHWMMGIPIVGAILGDRVVEPTQLHRWAQRWLIAAASCAILGMLAALVPIDTWMAERVPNNVRIAAGMLGGNYDQIAKYISADLQTLTGRVIQSQTTEGSIDNVQRLLNGQVDLALVQASTVHSSKIAVIAPLYYEAVHVIVRDSSPARSIKELVGQRIAVGPEGSGSRSVASLLLDWHGLKNTDVQIEATAWQAIQSDPMIDAAFAVVQVGNVAVRDALKLGGYRLLEIPNALQFSLVEPVFHPLVISNDQYPDVALPPEGLTSVATTAFLAARQNTSNALVRAVLEALYTPEMIEKCGIFPAERAAHWQGLAWHPAASEFFEPLRKLQP